MHHLLQQRPMKDNENENENQNGDFDEGRKERKSCGVFTKAGDKKAFKEAIMKLYGDRELCKEMEKNGRQFVMDNLTKEVGTQKYVEVIRSVANKS